MANWIDFYPKLFFIYDLETLQQIHVPPQITDHCTEHILSLTILIHRQQVHMHT